MGIIELPNPLEFQWDAGNDNKNLAKHAVSNQECEEVFVVGQTILAEDFLHSKVEGRFIAVGVSKNSRVLNIVFTIRNNSVRVISARDTSRKERIFYEKTIKIA